MKTCPNCKIRVGGSPEYCPLCQSQLLGEGEPARYPHVVPEQRRYSLAYKVIAFLLLTAVVICMSVDFLVVDGELHWSLPVLIGVVGTLILLRALMKRRRNAPKLLFQTLILVSAVLLLCDWVTGWNRFSIDLVIPVLCTVALVLNFIFAFVNRRFTANRGGTLYCLSAHPQPGPRPVGDLPDRQHHHLSGAGHFQGPGPLGRTAKTPASVNCHQGGS